MAEVRPLVLVDAHEAAPCEVSEVSELVENEGGLNIRVDYRWLRTRCAAAFVAVAIAAIVVTTCLGGFSSHQRSLKIGDAQALLDRADGQTQKRVVRVTCVGDSLTAGIPFGPDSAYPEVLQGMLGDDYLILNYGDPGKTVIKQSLCSGWTPWDPLFRCHSLKDWGTCDYWNTTLWTATLNSLPDMVLMMWGPNDAKGCNWNLEAFIADYVDMIRGVKSLPTKPKVYLIEPPPLFPPFPGNISKDIYNKQFRWIIPDIAKLGGADGVIDAWTYLGGSNWQMMHTYLGGQCYQIGENCTEDGLHPSKGGYHALATLVHKELFRGVTTPRTTTEAPTTSAKTRKSFKGEKDETLVGT